MKITDFKQFKIAEEKDITGKTRYALLAKDGGKIADISENYSMNYINNDTTAIISTTDETVSTYIISVVDDNTYVSMFNSPYNYEEVKITKLDEDTITIKENGLYYLYDVIGMDVMSDGFNSITKSKDGYLGYLKIVVEGYVLYVSAEIEEYGTIKNDTIYIPELDMQIKGIGSIQDIINENLKEITKRVKKLQKVQNKNNDIIAERDAYLKRKRDK